MLLICDNLDGQTCEEFLEKISELGCKVRYGPKGKTDLWQPADAGYGKELKVLTKHEQQEWLECDINLYKWVGNSEKKFTAKERRILLTQWVGKAHRKLQLLPLTGQMTTRLLLRVWSALQ